MARPGVTYQDILAAANELKGQGRSITIENVRAVLGTGSLGTINNHLRKWKETQNTTQKIASKENIPEELVSLMKGLWENTLIQANEHFVPLEKNYQNELTELKNDLEKYKRNNQRWQNLFNQWQQEKAQIANEKLTLEQALDFSHKEAATLQAKQDVLLQQLQDKLERINELYRLHKQTQDNLEHYRESAREQRLLDQQQFEQEKQQLQLDIKLIQEQSVLQRDKLYSLQQTNQDITNKYVNLEKSHIHTESQLQKITIQLHETEKSQCEHIQSKQHWQTQYNETRKILENKISEFINTHTELKLASQLLADTKQSLVDLKNRNRLLADDKLILAQEKSQLEGQLKQMQSMITA